MIREDRFVVSRQRYAVDLSSMNLKVNDLPFAAYGTIRTVWYRRRSGITAACIGQLWDSQREVPKDAAEFLAHHDDGRYGARCRSRWDGESFWSESQDPEVSAADLALLRPMLDSYPQIPDGFDGWWRF